MSESINSSNSLEHYFTYFLREKLNQPLLPKLQTLSATFSITLLAEENSVWTLEIKNGLLVSIQRGLTKAQCGFRLKPEIFSAIAAGKLSPQFAFFKRQVDIEGQLDTGLRLATVLAEFFVRFPYVPGRVS